MASNFGALPSSIPGDPAPFTFRVPDEELARLTQLVQAARIPQPTWYNKQDRVEFGISRDWLVEASTTWATKFDWRQHEEKINSYPNFKVSIGTEAGGDFDVHFAALFSKREDAVPVIFLHGWPGSFMEFFPMMDLLVEKYTPETLPYHVVVPSIPDYCLSSGPSKDVELTLGLAAEVMNNLMINLGFDAYVAQGGDVGSFLSCQLAGTFDECKASHINLYFLQPSQEEAVSVDDTTPKEQAQLAHAQTWSETGSAYAYFHGTRPSTIGLVLSANPVAMLAWIGEKFVQWADSREPLSLDTILAAVSLYWFTDTSTRGMWAYRSATPVVGATISPTALSLSKPLGFSSFPAELACLPKKWAEKLFPNLVLFSTHELGGHFAALEQPAALLQDVEEFVEKTKGEVVGSK